MSFEFSSVHKLPPDFGRMWMAYIVAKRLASKKWATASASRPWALTTPRTSTPFVVPLPPPWATLPSSVGCSVREFACFTTVSRRSERCRSVREFACLTFVSRRCERWRCGRRRRRRRKDHKLRPGKRRLVVVVFGIDMVVFMN